MTQRRALGIDISAWQGNVNFTKMRQAGASFVIVKASQNKWPDKKFEENWQNSRNNGLLRGAYHFYDLREGSSNAKEQARFFANLMKKDMGELRPVLDFETPGVEGYPSLPEHNLSVKIVYDFLETFYQETNVYPMLYTNLYGIQVLSPLSDYFKSKELWIAWYAPEAFNPKCGEWPTWRMWQYKANGNGLAFGAESKGLDMNAFNGTEEDLYAYANSLGIAKQRLTIKK